jgi:hypothetical protein
MLEERFCNPICPFRLTSSTVSQCHSVWFGTESPPTSQTKPPHVHDGRRERLLDSLRRRPRESFDFAGWRQIDVRGRRAGVARARRVHSHIGDDQSRASQTAPTGSNTKPADVREGLVGAKSMRDSEGRLSSHWRRRGLFGTCRETQTCLAGSERGAPARNCSRSISLKTDGFKCIQ